MNQLTNEEKYQRLSYLINSVGSLKKFTNLLKVNYATFYNYINNNEQKRTPVSDDAINVISQYFDIPKDYFLTDTMKIKDFAIDKEKFGIDIKKDYKQQEEAKEQRQGVYKMKLLSTSVAANFNTPIYENNHFEEFFVSKSIFERYKKTSFLVKVKGNSMSPLIPNNAIVVITKIENWKDIEHQTVAVAYDCNFTIKKIKKNDYEKGFVILHAENPDFSEKKIDVKEIREVFKVERIIDAELE